MEPFPAGPRSAGRGASCTVAALDAFAAMD